MLHHEPLIFTIFGILSLLCVFILAKNPKNEVAFAGSILLLAVAAAPTLGINQYYPPVSIFVIATIGAVCFIKFRPSASA